MIAEQLQPLARPIDEFSPHPANSRDGDVGAISASLQRFAQQKPIVVQKSTGSIVAGNHLWKAAKALGWETIAANVVDLSDEEALAYLEADNRSADLGSYFRERQAENLKVLADGAGLEGTGWDDDDLDDLLSKLAKQDDAGLGEPIHRYELIFDTDAELERFHGALKVLRAKYPDEETHAARLVTHLERTTE